MNMDGKGRRSSIRKAAYKDEDTTEVRLTRRISFSGKKFVRIFDNEEEPKNWDNCYEISDHTNGDETASTSSKTGSERTISKSNKSNVQNNSGTTDVIDRSQDCFWQIENSVNYTLLPQEINRQMKSSNFKNESLAEKCSFLTHSEREILRKDKNCYKVFEETLNTDVIPTESANTFQSRNLENNNNVSNETDGKENFEQKIKKFSILADSDDIMEETLQRLQFDLKSKLVSTKTKPCNKIILQENIAPNDSMDFVIKNSTINFSDDSMDFSKHPTNYLKEKQENAMPLEQNKITDIFSMDISAQSTTSNLEFDKNLLSPLIPSDCITGSCNKKKLTFRQLNDEIEHGRLRIFADGPKTPTIDKSNVNKPWYLGEHNDKGTKKQLFRQSPLKDNVEMDLSNLTSSNIKVPKINASITQHKKYRYSQADEKMLDNTNFLSHAKLDDDDTQLENISKRSNTRKTTYFSTNIDESVHDPIQFLDDINNLNNTHSLELSYNEVTNFGSLKNNNNNKVHPKSRKTLHFENIDSDIITDGNTICKPISKAGENITLQNEPEQIKSVNVDFGNSQLSAVFKSSEIQHTPKLNRLSQVKEFKTLQFTPGRSLIEFEDLEQQCQDKIYTPIKSKPTNIMDSKILHVSTYEPRQIDIDLEDSRELQNELTFEQNVKKVNKNQLTESNTITESINQEANKRAISYEAKNQDQITEFDMTIETFDHKANNHLLSKATEIDRVTEFNMVLENCNHEVNQNTIHYDVNTKNVGMNEISMNNHIDMEVDEAAYNPVAATKKRRQTNCIPVDILPECCASNNTIVSDIKSLQAGIDNCSISERDNSAICENNRNTPANTNNASKLDISINKTDINSMAFKRDSQNLTPILPNSKKRQTIIFDNYLLESSPLPTNTSVVMPDAGSLADNQFCEHFAEEAKESSFSFKASPSNVTIHRSKKCLENSNTIPDIQQKNVNTNIRIYPNDSAHLNSFKLESELTTSVKQSIQIPRRDGNHKIESILGLESNDIEELQKSNSLLSLTFNDNQIQDQTHKPISIKKESKFKRLAQINRDFLNLSNDTTFLNGGQFASNELLEETRISLVETLIHDEDETDETVGLSEVGGTTQNGELNSPVNRECASALQISETSKGSFITPQSTWINNAMDRLRRIRSQPRISDVHEYWRRKYMDETINNNKLKSEFYTLVDEMCNNSQAVRNLKCTTTIKNELLKPSKPMITFVNRLKPLIKEQCPNWIFDYQLEGRNQYIFSHRKLPIMQLLVEFEYTDVLGIDINVKSVNVDFSGILKKNWNAYDYLMEFHLNLKKSYMLLPFSTINNEETLLHLLVHIDKTCIEVAIMCNDLWDIVCMKQAKLVRESGRIIIRKVVRKVVSTKEHPKVTQQEFVVEVNNVQKMCFKDILEPHVSHFGKCIQDLPVGLNFLSKFLEDPTKFLKHTFLN